MLSWFCISVIIFFW